MKYSENYQLTLNYLWNKLQYNNNYSVNPVAIIVIGSVKVYRVKIQNELQCKTANELQREMGKWNVTQFLH